MGEQQTYRQLIVWKRAIELTFAVYAATRDFPKEELFGLTSQLRRAAVSVASNIAEGKARETRGEFRQFLGTASGSLAEVETQLVIARGLGIGRKEKLAQCEELAGEVTKMLTALRKSIEKPTSARGQISRDTR